MKGTNAMSILSPEVMGLGQGQGRADGTVAIPNGSGHSPYVRELLARGEREQHQEGEAWAEADGVLAAAQVGAVDRYREEERQAVADEGRPPLNQQPWLRTGPGRALRAGVLAAAVAATAGLAHSGVAALGDDVVAGWVLVALVATVLVAGAYLAGALLRRVHNLSAGENRRRVLPVVGGLAALIVLAGVVLGIGAEPQRGAATVTVLVLLLCGVVAAIGFADRPQSDGERAHRRGQEALVLYVGLVEQRRALWLARRSRTLAIRSRVPELVAAYYAANLQARRNSLTAELRQLAETRPELGAEPAWLSEKPDFDPAGLSTSDTPVRSVRAA